MTKYVLDYPGGCKGDFLCNFMNYNEIFFEKHGYKSKTMIKSLKSEYEKNNICWSFS